MKILQLITGLGVGGAERVVVELSNELSSRGIDVFVVSLNNDISILEQYKQVGFFYRSLCMSKSLFSFINAIFFVRRFIRINNITVVHAHMFHSLLLGILIKVFNPSLKLVFTSHNFSGFGKLRSFFISNTKFLREIDVVFSPNQHVDLNVNPHIIRNAVSSKAPLSKINNREYTFLFLGRLEKQKNPVALIHIISKMIDKNSKFLLAGDGYLRSEIESKIAQYGLEKRVILLGKVTDIDALFSRVDCLVLPSLWEGLPMVLLEAGSRGIPVVATPVGAIPEVIDETCGYLSSLDNFTKRLDEVVEHPDIASLKGVKLRQVISKEFSLELLVDKHILIYEKLANG